MSNGEKNISLAPYYHDMSHIPTFTRNKYRLVGDIVRNLHLPPDSLVIEGGCGNRRLADMYITPHLPESHRYITFDLPSHQFNSLANLNAEIQHIPIADQCADAVICLDVLEHLPNKNGVLLALNEMGRILKPNGKFIISVPSVYNLDRFNPPFKYGTHNIRLTPQKWMKMLEERGLHIHSTMGAGIAELLPSIALVLKLLVPDSSKIDQLLLKMRTLFQQNRIGDIDLLLYQLSLHKIPIVKEFCDGFIMVGTRSEN